jgi:hypothetical protein
LEELVFPEWQQSELEEEAAFAEGIALIVLSGQIERRYRDEDPVRRHGVSGRVFRIDRRLILPAMTARRDRTHVVSIFNEVRGPLLPRLLDRRFGRHFVTICRRLKVTLI